MKPIEAIDDGGEITVGHIHTVGLAPADGHNTLTMLARRDGETLKAVLKRLDRALGRCYDDGTVARGRPDQRRLTGPVIKAVSLAAYARTFSARRVSS